MSDCAQLSEADCERGGCVWAGDELGCVDAELPEAGCAVVPRRPRVAAAAEVPRVKSNLWEWLPNELAFKVFDGLELPDIGRLAKTSRAGAAQAAFYLRETGANGRWVFPPMHMHVVPHQSRPPNYSQALAIMARRGTGLDVVERHARPDMAGAPAPALLRVGIAGHNLDWIRLIGERARRTGVPVVFAGLDRVRTPEMAVALHTHLGVTVDQIQPMQWLFNYHDNPSLWAPMLRVLINTYGMTWQHIPEYNRHTLMHHALHERDTDLMDAVGLLGPLPAPTRLYDMARMNPTRIVWALERNVTSDSIPQTLIDLVEGTRWLCEYMDDMRRYGIRFRND